MDRARLKNNRHLKKVESELTKIYKEAESDITAKWNAYMVKGQKRLNKLYNAYIKETDKAKKALLKKEYESALSTYTLRNKWYQEMVNQVANNISNVNKKALEYINGQMPGMYANGFNQIKTDYPNIDLTLLNEDAVRELTLNNKLLLPPKKLDPVKDVAWNLKQLNSSVLQGILQGESIMDLALRIYPIVEHNKVASIRTARTMATGAENKGRLDSYKRVESMGAVVKKEWIATVSDGRTRKWHLSMDGQQRGLNGTFIDGNGRPLRYPGDPQGHPNSVYNCRCALKAVVTGIKDSKGKIIDL